MANIEYDPPPIHSVKPVSPGTNVEVKTLTPPVETEKPTRTRNAEGKFVADDPTTVYNEAWSDGKSQAKKSPKK